MLFSIVVGAYETIFSAKHIKGNGETKAAFATDKGIVLKIF